jgi:hypothetical protein
MNAVFSPRTVRWLMLVLLSLSCLPFFASIAFASTEATPILQANFIFELVSDRARLIQVSLVFVTLGCALIWWYK